jgi:hypothetical protein
MAKREFYSVRNLIDFDRNQSLGEWVNRHLSTRCLAAARSTSSASLVRDIYSLHEGQKPTSSP